MLACVLMLGVAVSTAIFAQADSVADQINEALRQAERGAHANAVAALDAVIRRQPDHAQAYYWRGRSNFCLGRIKEAVADFDRHVELEPRGASRQWERGIALYYAGRFDDGARQFELYQTYHDNDVENSVWRYLCLARSKGVEEARKTMLPIKNDTRVPMMAIYDLYRGERKPEDVLKAVEEGSPNEQELNQRRFYAHLYLGLWHEAQGEKKEAQRHLAEAEKHKIGHYMWDVARVHNELRRAEQEDAANREEDKP